jgi:hypothetical protein
LLSDGLCHWTFSGRGTDQAYSKAMLFLPAVARIRELLDLDRNRTCIFAYPLLMRSVLFAPMPNVARSTRAAVTREQMSGAGDPAPTAYAPSRAKPS